MVGVVQLAEHWFVVPGVVGSSPITHPIKKDRPSGLSFFMGWMGLEESGIAEGGAKNMPGACFPAVGESHAPQAHNRTA